MSRHTCDAIGVCQQHTPACLGCEHHALQTSVQASRDTGCCAFLPEDDNTPTPIERIGYWCGVGLLVGASVVCFFGGAGYLVAKFLTAP